MHCKIVVIDCMCRAESSELFGVVDRKDERRTTVLVEVNCECYCC